jgi:hypothetical protein
MVQPQLALDPKLERSGRLVDNSPRSASGRQVLLTGHERLELLTALGGPKVANKPIRETTEPGDCPDETPAGATDAASVSREQLEEALDRERGLLRTMIDSLPANIYA